MKKFLTALLAIVVYPFRRPTFKEDLASLRLIRQEADAGRYPRGPSRAEYVHGVADRLLLAVLREPHHPHAREVLAHCARIGLSPFQAAVLRQLIAERYRR